MNSYHSRSWSRWLFGIAARVLAVVVGLVLLLAVIKPLLTVIAGVAIAVMIGVLWARWRLFRYRGW